MVGAGCGCGGTSLASLSIAVTAPPCTHPSLASGVEWGGMWSGWAGRVRGAGQGSPHREPAPWARNKYIAPHKIQRGEGNVLKKDRYDIEPIFFLSYILCCNFHASILARRFPNSSLITSACCLFRIIFCHSKALFQ